MPSIKRLALLILVVVPLAAWFIVKPVRLVAPVLAGLSCTTDHLCIDDISRSKEAEALYSDALTYVSANVGALEGKPRFIFCSTEGCANYFGLGARSAVTLGGFGTVVRPRAWKPYYVRHELIHRLQVQRFGSVGILLKPSWFVEGMAYALSEDPREPLAEPWQGYRSQFRQWYGVVGKAQVWQRAAEL